ncbi:hypothetical protein SAMN02745166_01223 [Prosthecobacter debontii]|uniref:Heavy-metal resistance n=1 Tax=Prosthecobacter debontii TaxID=48467 RepID=A0A1T4X8K7_9BACT|nr:hypothetical protein [Prosthecobacter debontii]SKA85924.1 hypothetical protein SAMN02745166_01223 [Prosthecobacter debontii]
MSIREKLLIRVIAVIALAIITHEIVYYLRPKPATAQQMGLEWLKEEYHLPNDAFARIKDLHRDYFIRCDEMCANMERAHRPLLQRSRTQASQEWRMAALKREKAICENCLDNMVDHLRTVASLMPAAEGERFLKDILPEVINPPELQKLRSQVIPLQ